MKMTQRISARSLPAAVSAVLALAGCSDPQDISPYARKDAGSVSSGSGGSSAAGTGGDPFSAAGGSGQLVTSAGSAGMGGTAGSGTSGAGGSTSPDDAGASTEAAAAPTPAKIGTALFNADFEDGKSDSWTTYDGTLEIASGGAGASAKALGFRTTTPASIGKAVTMGASTATSFVLESDIMFQAGGQASLIFRVSMPTAGGPDNLTAYAAGLDSGAGNVWAAKFANMYSPLGSVPISVNTLTWYHLRVDVSPAGFVVFLDGTYIMSVNDASLTGGGMVGLRGDWGPIGDAGMAPKVLFDNVKQSAIGN